MLYGSHAKGVNRRDRGALCNECVGAFCGVRVSQSHAPAPRVLPGTIAWPFTFAARINSTEQQRQEQSTKAHGAVIDVAAAPGQPSATYGHMTLPAFAAVSP